MTSYAYPRRFPAHLLLLAAVLLALLGACQKYDNYQPKLSTVQELSVSTTTPVLSQANADNQAIAFTWTIGTNRGTEAAIDYTLQLDKRGNSFAAPVEVTVDRGSLAQAYTSNQLNRLLVDRLRLPVGAAQDVDVRVKAVEASGQNGPEYSNVVTIAVTPYNAVTTLWIVGDATPNGWDINNPNQMRQSATDASVYTYNEVLRAGEFKITASRGDWNAPFYRPTTDHPPLTDRGVQLSAGSPDHKWQIITPGAYKISLNIRTLSISIEPFVPYAALWLVGDAAPAGWNINSPTPMTRDAANPHVFRWTGPLTVGEFKIPTATGNWGTDYFMPAVNHQPLTDRTVALIRGGSPDNKWQVTQARTYTIVLDQLHETIDIQ